jgi:DNA end-binding protein Ku
MIQSRGKGMMLTTLRDPDEIRKPEEAFRDIDDVKVDKENLQMAETLIERLTGKFDLDMFEDRYQEALHKLVTAKQKGKKIIYAEEPERESNVVDITAALKASLRGTGKAANTNATRGTAKKRAGARTKSPGKRGKRAA